MWVPALLSLGVLGALALSAKQPAATPAAAPPSPPPAPPPTMAPPVTTTSTGPQTVIINPNFPQQTLNVRVGDTISMRGVPAYDDNHPEGYKLDFPPGGTLAYQKTGPNDFRMIAPGRFSISWSPNNIVVVDVVAVPPIASAPANPIAGRWL